MKLDFYLLEKFGYKKDLLPIVLELSSMDTNCKISDKWNILEITILQNNEEIANTFTTESLNAKRQYYYIEKGKSKYQAINIADYFIGDDVDIKYGYCTIIIKLIIHEMLENGEKRIHNLSCSKEVNIFF